MKIDSWPNTQTAEGRYTPTTDSCRWQMMKRRNQTADSGENPTSGSRQQTHTSQTVGSRRKAESIRRYYCRIEEATLRYSIDWLFKIVLIFFYSIICEFKIYFIFPLSMSSSLIFKSSLILLFWYAISNYSFIHVDGYKISLSFSTWRHAFVSLPYAGCF